LMLLLLDHEGQVDAMLCEQRKLGQMADGHSQPVFVWMTVVAGQENLALASIEVKGVTRECRAGH